MRLLLALILCLPACRQVEVNEPTAGIGGLYRYTTNPCDSLKDPAKRAACYRRGARNERAIRRQERQTP